MRGPRRTSQRVILHADMDAFYASVEQRDRPELRGRPVIVGGTGSRGVVSAASYEARRFGVRSAMPTAVARRLCPDGVYLGGDMARYVRESRRIFEIFRSFTPDVEGLSLDEAFLDLTGTERLLGPPRAVGEQLRARVREETDLAVSVGIAPVKLVAKIASDAAKPDGLLEIAPDEVRAFLAPLPVGRIWGVGPTAEERLHGVGVHTIGDLADLGDLADADGGPRRRLEDCLGDQGAALARLARGEDLREVEPYREPVSMGEENTFSEDVRDPVRLEAAITAHAESVARRLRREGLRARTVVLKWREATRRAPGPRGYPLHTRRRTLPRPSDDGPELARTARALLREASPEDALRLIGVAATGLVLAGADGQLALFGPSEEEERRDRLNRALDDITDRFGTGAVVRAAESAPERAGLSLQIKRGEIKRGEIKREEGERGQDERREGERGQDEGRQGERGERVRGEEEGE